MLLLFLQARHDHNKIAPCGMIKVFWTELKLGSTSSKYVSLCRAVQCEKSVW